MSFNLEFSHFAVQLSFSYLAAFDAVGADANTFGSAFNDRMHGLKIWAPAAASYVVRVRDVVAELRAFAANVAYLCHCITPTSQQVPWWDRAAAKTLTNTSERLARSRVLSDKS